MKKHTLESLRIEKDTEPLPPFDERVYRKKLDEEDAKKAAIVAAGLLGMSGVDTRGLLMPGDLSKMLESGSSNSTQIPVEDMSKGEERVLVQVGE